MSHSQASLQAADGISEARRYLSANAERVNRVLIDFWARKQAAWAGFPEIIASAFETYDRMTRSGKKIRAGLALLGYDMSRGARTTGPGVEDGAYRAAGAIEILHNAFLIHDDIIDHSDMRRSMATVHRRYADANRLRFASEEEALAYGRAIALNFGDKGQALAQELLFSSEFPGDVTLSAIALLSRVTADTVAGQLLDVRDVPLARLAEETVLQIHRFKTAHYTVMLPLQMGALLAGAPPEVLPRIEDYAIPVGIAFQVKDDLLGMYGEEQELGKPVGSDVREGKKTLLMVHAYAAGGADDRGFLEAMHGNEAVTRKELERVRAIVRDTGALERSETFARELVERGKTHIPSMCGEARWQRILAGLADHLIQRRF